jgi:hypothetical protein
VILDQFLSTEINEATNKLQVASAKLVNNGTRLKVLVAKLQSANERKSQEESEKINTDAEVMC